MIKKALIIFITGMMLIGSSFTIFAAPSPDVTEGTTETYTSVDDVTVPLGGLFDSEMSIIVGSGQNLSPKTGEGLMGMAFSVMAGIGVAGMLLTGKKRVV